MHCLITIAIIMASFAIFLTNGEFYSSVHQMSKVMDFELKMLKNMQKFIGKNQNKLDYLKEWVLWGCVCEFFSQY